jgi:hypothetical protein
MISKMSLARAAGISIPLFLLIAGDAVGADQDKDVGLPGIDPRRAGGRQKRDMS